VLALRPMPMRRSFAATVLSACVGLGSSSAIGCKDYDPPAADADATTGDTASSDDADTRTTADADTAVDADTAADVDAAVDADVSPIADGDADTLPDGTIAGECGTYRGAKMVKITPASGPAFCIDATETTNAQYNVFVAAKYPTDTQPAVCAWNSAWGSIERDKDELPRVYVNWCQARGYCEWAGKRLCGKLGDGANPVAPIDAPDRTKSEWTFACTGGKAENVYPYGTYYQSGFCNALGAVTKQVATHPKCIGVEAPFTSVFDLSGNVYEWENSCLPTGDAGPKTTECSHRGGSAFGGAAEAPDWSRCAYAPRDGVYPTMHEIQVVDQYIGMRCCKSL
jgi:formylglycine-generating enzyme